MTDAYPWIATVIPTVAAVTTPATTNPTRADFHLLSPGPGLNAPYAPPARAKTTTKKAANSNLRLLTAKRTGGVKAPSISGVREGRKRESAVSQTAS
jgi:hypothetical protein